MAACACASEGRLYGLNEVKGILERGDDADFMPADADSDDGVIYHRPVQHKNIRGRDYYSNKPLNDNTENENGNKK